MRDFPQHLIFLLSALADPQFLLQPFVSGPFCSPGFDPWLCLYHSGRSCHFCKMKSLYTKKHVH